MHNDSTPPPILVCSSQVDKNKQLINDAVSKGANILAGKFENNNNNDNDNKKEEVVASMRPVILEDVTREMEIYHTESFGPSVSLFVVDTEDEAIQLANDTDYGLSASVYTESLNRGLRVAREIESGYVYYSVCIFSRRGKLILVCRAIHINSMSVHDETSLPHGGMKKSGYGRFGGPRGLDEFLTTKNITWMDGY